MHCTESILLTPRCVLTILRAAATGRVHTQSATQRETERERQREREIVKRPKNRRKKDANRPTLDMRDGIAYRDAGREFNFGRPVA